VKKYFLHLALVACAVTACFIARAGGQELRLVRAAISAADNNDGQPVAAASFHVGDHIYYFTEVTWADASQPAGSHALAYKWYTGDKLTFSFNATKDFATLPYFWSAWISGSHLGLGHHRAELDVDGKVLDTREFDIVPDGQPAH
jgi:hypothetical protein